MPSIAVRLSEAERSELDYLAQGDISKYVRNALFGDAKCNAKSVESIQWLGNRMEELLEDQAVLQALVRALADEVRELKAAPLPQPVAATVQGISRLEGMTLELLLLLRGSVSLTDRRRIHATIDQEGLPVWEESEPPPIVTTERRTTPVVQREGEPVRERKEGSWLGDWRKK